MELFLNLTWLSVCLLMVGGCLAWTSDRRGRGGWRVWVALGLLLVVLFPVISMSDDLLAQRAPAETEHLLRRYETPFEAAALWLALQSGLLALLAAFGSLALCGEAGFAPSILPPAALRERILRTAGVRPPPQAALAR